LNNLIQYHFQHDFPIFFPLFFAAMWLTVTTLGGQLKPYRLWAV